MKYFLDTNICIYIIKKKPYSVLEKLKKINMRFVGISSITLSELVYGVEKSSNPIQNRIALSEFLSPIEIFPFSNRAAHEYGKIRAQLEKKGKMIGPLDCLIASHCKSMNLIMVTNNEKEFSQIKTLKVENWGKN